MKLLKPTLFNMKNVSYIYQVKQHNDLLIFRFDEPTERGFSEIFPRSCFYISFCLFTRLRAPDFSLHAWPTRFFIQVNKYNRRISLFRSNGFQKHALIMSFKTLK